MSSGILTSCLLSHKKFPVMKFLTFFLVIFLSAGCSFYRNPTSENNINTNSNREEQINDISDEPDPKPIVTNSVEPDSAKIELPLIFQYEFTVSERGVANKPIYHFEISKTSNGATVKFTGYPRDLRKVGEYHSFNFEISNDEFRKIFYYVSKVKFEHFASDYSGYDATGCGLNTFRGPYQYELKIMFGKINKKIKFLEFCSKNGEELSELFELKKNIEEISYLKPHISKSLKNH